MENGVLQLAFGVLQLTFGVLHFSIFWRFKVHFLWFWDFLTQIGNRFGEQLSILRNNS
ncbi:MAG: hypothetical protein LBU34_09020 [Planctomycetaceae bacterium]|nr:hypothetical protein [Planctomycetaceae bacterium]